MSDQISHYLPNKTTRDCVQYYYLNKKSVAFKEAYKKLGTQFTCFTSTKVQILTQGTQFTGFTRTQVQILALGARFSVYLLYWYKSLSTDAKGAAIELKHRRTHHLKSITKLLY